MNEESIKRALIYIIVGVAIFIILKPKDEPENNQTSKPLTKAINASGRVHLVMPTGNKISVFDEDRRNDSLVCIRAFIDAYNNDESESVLTQLNNDIKNEYGLYLIKTSKDITVYDSTKKEVLKAKI